MENYRKILLQVSANIDNYQIELYTPYERAVKRIYSRKDSICICTDAPLLRMVATPLNSAYNTKLYFTIDVTCARIFSYYFRFSREEVPPPTPVEPINTFTLTDATYGLPIDGVLRFTGR